MNNKIVIGLLALSVFLSSLAVYGVFIKKENADPAGNTGTAAMTTGTAINTEPAAAGDAAMETESGMAGGAGVTAGSDQPDSGRLLQGEEFFTILHEETAIRSNTADIINWYYEVGSEEDVVYWFNAMDDLIAREEAVISRLDDFPGQDRWASDTRGYAEDSLDIMKSIDADAFESSDDAMETLFENYYMNTAAFLYFRAAAFDYIGRYEDAPPNLEIGG